jgi:hypothetical protein
MPHQAPYREQVLKRGNAVYPWDRFDPESYVHDNYAEFYEDDRRILQRVRDYFAGIQDTLRSDIQGIDVGAGANLYPSLAMLPFCRNVTLFERSANNRKWLTEQRSSFSPVWDKYWNTLATRPAYDKIDPREAFRDRANIIRGDIFKPPARDRWDMGTMFFVAESITQEENEFNRAVKNFIGLLRPTAPFAAAFMQESPGYHVGEIEFPAVPITRPDVEHLLEPLVDELELTSILSTKPLRDGYQGMILAVGRVRHAKK